MPVSNPKPTNPNLDLIWGASAIGRALNITESQFYHLAESGQIPAVKKIGAKWVADRAALAEFFQTPNPDV